jgi:hypothetical protein
MTNSEIGYYESPANGDGIVRSRTTKQIRAWQIPRKMRALESLNNELGKGEFPGIYILFETPKKRAYVGEAKNIYNRLKTHMVSPEDKIKNWDRAEIINDGRPAGQSDFNDAAVRKALEYYLIRLLKANKYEVVAQGEPQNLNDMQKFLFNSFRSELNYFLIKKTLITKELEKSGQELVHRDDLKKIIAKSGKISQKWSAYEAIIDGQHVFIREGSDKLPKGWQITFRDKFMAALKSGEGLLLVPRGPILFIPMTEIQKAIGGEKEYLKNTIDIFILFEDEKIILRYKQAIIDVTNFKLIS